MKKYLLKIDLTRPRPTAIPTRLTYKILRTVFRDSIKEIKQFWYVKTLCGRMGRTREGFIMKKLQLTQ